MMFHADSQKAAALIQHRAGTAPIDFAIVLARSMGGFADHLTAAVDVKFSDLPGLSASAGADDARIVIGQAGSARVAIICGALRFHECGDANVMRPLFEIMKLLGAASVVLTGAAGSARHEIKPGAIVTIRDHINFTGINPLLSQNDPERYVDLSRGYDSELRERFHVAANEIGRKVPQAVYFLMSGPSFETSAEVNAARTFGADIIGMSVVPEMLIARHLGLRVLAIAIVTNFAAGLSEEPISRDHIARVIVATMGSFSRVLMRFCEIWRLNAQMGSQKSR